MCRGEWWWWWWVDEAEELSRPAQVSSLLSGRCRGGGKTSQPRPWDTQGDLHARTKHARGVRTRRSDDPAGGTTTREGGEGKKRSLKALSVAGLAKPPQKTQAEEEVSLQNPNFGHPHQPRPGTTRVQPPPPPRRTRQGAAGAAAAWKEPPTHRPSTPPRPKKKEFMEHPPPQNKTTNDTQPAPHDRHTPWTCPAWRPCASPATTGTTRT